MKHRTFFFPLASVLLFQTAILSNSAHAQSNPKATKNPSEENKPKDNETKCVQVPISPTKGESSQTTDLYEAVKVFEEAFEKEDGSLFKSALHPALHRSESEKSDAFDGTIAQFGLKKPKLTKTPFFELTLTPGEQTAHCPGAQIRGVTGPLHQFAATHTISREGDQIRLFTLWSEIPNSLNEKRKRKLKWGLVMLHAQVWGAEKKSPAVLLDEAKSSAKAGEDLNAWLLGEAARRSLSANPYVQPNELKDAESLVSSLGQKIVPNEAQKNAAKAAVGWDLIEFSPVFQSSGIEIGLKLRSVSNKETSFKEHLNSCEAAAKAIARHLPAGVKTRFRGVECLSYKPEESLSAPPSAGSQFFTWQKLGL